MKVLAALIQFGLLEKTGKGDVKVTQRAVEILHGIDPADRNEAMLEAAFSPQLFQDIHNRFTDGIPSEGVIRSYLIQQDFMDAAIGPAISAFMETYRSVEHIRDSESHGASTALVPVSPEETPRTEMKVNPATSTSTAGAAQRTPNLEALELNKIGMNIQGHTVYVEGLLDLKGLEALTKKIEGLKVLLDPPPDDEETKH